MARVTIVRVLVSATPAQLARWSRKAMEARRGGERTSRSREIRRDGLLAATLAGDLAAAGQQLRSLANAIGAGLRPEEARQSLLDLDARLERIRARAEARV